MALLLLLLLARLVGAGGSALQLEGVRGLQQEPRRKQEGLDLQSRSLVT